MANIRVQTHRLKKGMKIASDVYTSSGVVIVPSGTEVTKEVLELLTKHFADDVMVEYTPKKKNAFIVKKSNGIDENREKKIKEFSQTFQIAEEAISQNFKAIVEQDKDIDVPALVSTVQEVVNKAENDTELFDMLFSIRRTSENLYTHSVNVALYAQLLARWVGFSPEEIEIASLAGLLHDIGHLKYTDKEENGFSLHDELEKRCHEKHSVHGYKLLQNKTVDYRVKQAILTHHERLDESGFQMGVSFENINGVARVLAIADIYATLTVDEEGHPAMLPFEVLKYMQAQEFGKYDAVYLRTFMEHLAQTFIQQEVLLNNGKKGTIIMLNKLDFARPLVQVEDYYVDLSVQKDLAIKELLN